MAKKTGKPEKEPDFDGDEELADYEAEKKSSGSKSGAKQASGGGKKKTPDAKKSSKAKAKTSKGDEDSDPLDNDFSDEISHEHQTRVKDLEAKIKSLEDTNKELKKKAMALDEEKRRVSSLEMKLVKLEKAD
ncbi:MAG: hypothetical protein QCI38_06115, partial [Candidatus Thermoplasmatota archaeon]|nr:hypothetical protein [Candidatus Thermoplasmatota archaeon]